MTTSGKNFLLVDDDFAILEMVGEGLRHSGFTVFKAKHPPEALAKVKSVELDYALVDLDLGWPEMNGLDLIRELKQENPGMMAILMTGFHNISVAVEATRVDEIEHLIKPFRIDQVLTMFDRLEQTRLLRLENEQLHIQVEQLKKYSAELEQRLADSGHKTETISKRRLPYEADAARSYAQQQTRTMPDFPELPEDAED
jgi:ActR/RegA family two-component response regulator